MSWGSFEDVLIRPEMGVLSSRSDACLSTSIAKGVYADKPFIAANMDTIASTELAQAMHQEGCTTFLHRYQTIDSMLGQLKQVPDAIPCVGVGEEAYQNAIKLWNQGARAICIDVAHGHHINVLKLLDKLTAVNVDRIIAGNIATYQAASDLINAGATGLKVGIGPGEVCRTRNQTGCGVPQIDAIIDVNDCADIYDIPVIADGGFREPGDVAKAIVAGASAIMSGHFFSRCHEANNGGQYRGMASQEAQQAFKGSSKNIEGVAIEVEPICTVAEVVKELTEGLQSAISYCGKRTVGELIGMQNFVRKR